MAFISMEAKDFDRLTDAIAKFGDGAEREINKYLHEKGGDKIGKSIHGYLPASGRTWKGKKAPAQSVDPFKKTGGNLEVKVHTKSAYHYLYFPDDGSNTRRHFGDQRFMQKGAEGVQSEIGSEIINQLINNF